VSNPNSGGGNMILQMSTKDCPVDITVRILANKWTVPILKELLTGPKRPSDLERCLKGLSAKTLAERLHDLQSWKIIERHSYPEVPPRVEYSLTELGMGLEPVFNALSLYGFMCKKEATPESSGNGGGSVQCNALYAV
ncbi:MAG: helix-turn-helix transcriptional regulator, partial [Cyanobacteria bacterium]|nr:helix-turn-helix transcriptional regulator [Cyanobacteriota bacterium]